MKRKVVMLLPLLKRSKIFLPGLLLFIAWSITLFTFYLPKTQKAAVEGIYIKRTLQTEVSSTITPTPLGSSTIVPTSVSKVGTPVTNK